MTHTLSIDASAFLRRRPSLLIGGQWRTPVNGATIAVVNPATCGDIAEIAAGDTADIDLAVSAARHAFDSGPWSGMSGGERARLLWDLSDRLLARADLFAELETLDNGKPFRDTLAVDLPVGAALLRYYAGWATKLKGETVQIGAPGEYHAYTEREPVGVVGQIIPWNFPLLMAILKIAPALAAGCTLVLKPAEDTPLTALLLGELIQEAGFPPGVVNIVTGYGETAGAALAAHQDIDKIAFTGSTEVGRKIIVAYADPEAVIKGATTGIFFNAGQSCMAGSRLYVHRSCYQQVVGGIVERAAGIVVGDGFDPASQIGPLVSARQMTRVLGYIQSGRDEGATCLTGGTGLDRTGYFVRPTVFADVMPKMRIMREEIFGPVLQVSAFDTEDPGEIAALANDTSYGLAASLWTRDIGRAHALIPKIKSGQVWVNGHHVGGADLPLGGYKQSGWGRELGREGVEAYTQIKSVAFALKPPGEWLALKG